MSVELYRQEGSNFRSVRVRIEGDELILDTQDMGEVTESVWGDADYEFWTSVRREHWGDLLVALVVEYMSGRPDATDRLRDICREHDVPHVWDSWV